MGGAGVASFVGTSTELLGGLGFDECLQHQAHGLTEQVEVSTGAQRVEQVGQGRLVEGHRFGSPS